MKFLKRLWQMRCRKDRESNKKKVIEKAYSLFQIIEYKGEVWFTYDGNLVCPCSMFKEEATKAVFLMREWYVARTPKLGLQ